MQLAYELHSFLLLYSNFLHFLEREMQSMRTISDVIYFLIETLGMFSSDFYIFLVLSLCSSDFLLCFVLFSFSKVFLYCLRWTQAQDISKIHLRQLLRMYLKSDILVKTKNDRVDNCRNPLRNDSLSYLGRCQRRLKYKV